MIVHSKVANLATADRSLGLSALVEKALTRIGKLADPLAMIMLIAMFWGAIVYFVVLLPAVN